MIVSATPGATLTCVGLGSCVGVALFDRVARVAGLAHVMLPSAPPAAVVPAGHYADLAVPALIAMVVEAGAARAQLEAILAGGATLFATGAAPSLGDRNVAAVRQALTECGVAVRAHATGGARGRTLHLTVGPRMRATARIAGGADELIHDAGPTAGSTTAREDCKLAPRSRSPSS